MRCFLAAFDQAHRSGDGTYWTWRHPNLPLPALDVFYYDLAAKHWPVGHTPIPADSLRGGCASVGDEWVCWYRYVEGGCDPAGRPGRYVLLAAFVELSDHHGRDWSGVLESPLFQRLAGQAKSSCPVPAPETFVMEWDPPPIGEVSAPGDSLKRNGRDMFEAAIALRAVAEVCSTMPLGDGFECSVARDARIAQVVFNGHEQRRQRLNAVPDSCMTANPEFSTEAGFSRCPLLERLVQEIVPPDKWTRARAGRDVAAYVVVFIVGVAIGMVIGWQFHRLTIKPREIQQHHESGMHFQENRVAIHASIGRRVTKKHIRTMLCEKFCRP